MIIMCPNCSARYSIVDAEVGTAVFKFTCRKCGQTDIYHPPASAVSEGGQTARTAKTVLLVVAIVLAIWIGKKYWHARSMCSDWCSGVADWSEFLGGVRVDRKDRSSCTNTCSWMLFFDKFGEL